MKRQLFSLLLVISAVGCMAETAQEQPAQETPLREDVPPIRNTAIKLLVMSNLTYSAEDETLARRSTPDFVVEGLNSRGSSDGNVFSIASGVAANFNLTFTISNDGNDRFSGSLYVEGWGQGYITTVDSGQYTFTHASEMINALLDKFYVYVHLGWIDSRKAK